jgi:predicted kinase
LRAPRLASDRLLRRLADAADRASAIEIFLAYLLAVHPAIVPIVGARRVATATSLGRASELTLGEETLALLDARFPLLGPLRRPPPAPRQGVSRADVVLLMGIPAAGKSQFAEDLVTRGYERLNRDSLGGTLRGIVRRLDGRLREGATRIVLDNTYVSRATRSDVLRAAHAHGAAARCVFFATPLHEAQRNACLRMITCFGQVLEPAQIAARAKEHPAALGPGVLFRMARDLEPPSSDEGFAAIDVVSFVRRTQERGPMRTGSAIPIAVADDEATLRLRLRRAGAAPCLLYGWRPGADPRDEALGERLTQAHGQVVEVAWCPHAAGPPICWCRPPLPGLAVSFAHRHGIPLGELRLLPTD